MVLSGAKMVVMESRPVALYDNHSSAFECIQDLARTNRHDDSFFVADLGKVRMLVEQWFQKLPRVRPFYSVNCNSDWLLLRTLASFPEVGFHCSTRQNVESALECAQPNRLFYSNACWTRNALAAARSSDVALVGFDRESDLSRMAACGMRNKLILNICPDGQFDGSVVGCEVSKASELLRLAADLGLDCIGVGFTLGAGAQRPALFDTMIEATATLFEVGRSFGLNMNVLSLGGGFPSLFSPHMPSFEAICEQINASLDYYFGSELDNLDIIATPGRFFAASVFSLATRIVERREVDASDITKDDFDAGQRAFLYTINQGLYGAFGCRVAMPNCDPKCLPLFANLEADDRQSDLCMGSVLGPRLSVDEAADVIQERCRLRQMAVDEWLVWPNLGAYSMNNCGSLEDDEDEDQYNAPVYYVSKENDWKFINACGHTKEDHHQHVPTPFDGCSDGEISNLSEDSAMDLEPVEDLFTIFNWSLV